MDEENETASINNTNNNNNESTLNTAPLSSLKENITLKLHRQSESLSSSCENQKATIPARIVNMLAKTNNSPSPTTSPGDNPEQLVKKRPPRLKDLRNTPYSVSLTSAASVFNNCVMKRNLTMPMNPNNVNTASSCDSSTRLDAFPSAEISQKPNSAKASSSPSELSTKQQQIMNIKRFSSIRYPNSRSSRASLISRIRRFSENPNSSANTTLTNSARHTNQSTMSDLTSCGVGAEFMNINNLSASVSIRRHTSRRLKHSKTAKVLGFATLAFALTWLPYWLFEFGVLKLRPLKASQLGDSALAFEAIAMKLLKNSFYLNYMLNPLFYSFVNSRFRHNLWSILRKCGKLIVRLGYFFVYMCYCMCCWATCCSCCIQRSTRCYNWNNLITYRFAMYNFDRIWPTGGKFGFNSQGQVNARTPRAHQRKDRRRSRLNSNRSDLTNESVVYEASSESSVLNFRQSLCEFFACSGGKFVTCCAGAAAQNSALPETD
jgi:hypothetical protein